MKQWVCSYRQVHRADKVLLFFKKIEEFDCLRFECRWIEQANEKEEKKNEKTSGLLSKNNKKNWKKELQLSQSNNKSVRIAIVTWGMGHCEIEMQRWGMTEEKQGSSNRRNRPGKYLENEERREWQTERCSEREWLCKLRKEAHRSMEHTSICLTAGLLGSRTWTCSVMHWWL